MNDYEKLCEMNPKENCARFLFNEKVLNVIYEALQQIRGDRFGKD